MQLHFFLYNKTCFEYKAIINRKYKFNFCYFYNRKAKIIKISFINIFWNNS